MNLFTTDALTSEHTKKTALKIREAEATGSGTYKKESIRLEWSSHEWTFEPLGIKNK